MYGSTLSKLHRQQQQQQQMYTSVSSPQVLAGCIIIIIKLPN
jgi:hypothetical protein